MKTKSSTFKELNENYPCQECSAPCCKFLLIPHKSPATYMEMDFIRYVLNFPNINITVSKSGSWGILIEQECIHFDSESDNCRVHKTIIQPKTCSYFNPYQCNYKYNLEKGTPNSIYILTREKFENWVQLVKFNESGEIVEAPSFEASVKLLEKLK